LRGVAGWEARGRKALGWKRCRRKQQELLIGPEKESSARSGRGKKAVGRKGKGTADLDAEEVVAVGGHFDAIDGGGGGGGTAGGVVSSSDGIKLEAILQANERVQKERGPQIQSLIAPFFRSSLLWEK
jgi:hypothetical protein